MSKSVLLFLLGCCLGCSASVETVPVAGTVTLDGEPLAGAHVSFEPVRDKVDAEAPAVGSYATTDARGKFALQLIRGEAAGAMPGKHRVRISTSQPVDPSREDSPLTEERVPEPYRDGSLEFTVPAEGTEVADFSLKRK